MRRFCLQNVESILGDTKKDLPKRTGPFHYIREFITPQRLPARRLTSTDYQHFNIWLITHSAHSARSDSNSSAKFLPLT